MTAQEVCLILESCAKTGVAVLKFGNLEVTWSHPASFLAQTDPPALAPATEIAVVPNHTELNTQAREDNEIRMREDQLAMALIENPMLYEELLANQQLEDEDDEIDGESEFEPHGVEEA